MKSKLTLTLLSFVAVFSIGFTSCKKETVVQQGNNNPANNAYSEVLSVNPNQWATAGNGTFTASYKITNTLPWGKYVYGTDLTLLYISSSDPSKSGSEEYPLMGNGTILGDYSFYYGVSYDGSNGVVTITAESNLNNVTATAPNATLYFHAVYIQPFTIKDAQASNVNYNDFNAVKKAYNLQY